MRAPAAPPFVVSRAAAFADGGSIVVAGGLNTTRTSTDAVWRFDPSANGWTTDGTLARAAHDAGAARLGSNSFFFGGGAATTVDDVQQLARGARGSIVAHLPRPRSDVTVALIGSQAFLVGGYDGKHALADVLATSDGKTFRVVARLPVAVRYAALAVYQGQIYAFGGEIDPGGETDVVQRIDPQAGTARVIAHLPSALGHAAAASLGQKNAIFVAGGNVNGTTVSTIWLFSISDHTFTKRKETLPRPVQDAAPVIVGGTLYLVGGEANHRSLRSLVTIR